MMQFEYEIGKLITFKLNGDENFGRIENVKHDPKTQKMTIKIFLNSKQATD